MKYYTKNIYLIVLLIISLFCFSESFGKEGKIKLTVIVEFY